MIIDFYIIEPVLIAKSNIILDVKPWDDETDMEEMENAVRKIETDGLLWGACKFFLLFNIVCVDSVIDVLIFCSQTCTTCLWNSQTTDFMCCGR